MALSWKKKINILMVGLDAAGKSEILQRLKSNDYFISIPTVGFNVESVEYKDNNFMIWEGGGAELIRLAWKYIFQMAHGLIFVVDSTDRQRVTEARDELHQLLKEKPRNRNMPLLVFVNKQDMPNTLSAADITDKLGLHSLRSCQWHVQSACAISGNGLYEGLEWLSNNISLRKEVRALARFIFCA